MMESDDSVTGPINLGNPVEQTVKELSHQVVNLVGSNSKVSLKIYPRTIQKDNQISQKHKEFYDGPQLTNWKLG